MTQIPAEIWTPAELSAWRMPPEMRPSQWAERYRSLPHGQSPLPGPWENENAPYSRGIMDLAAAPGVAQLNVCKAAQIGVSEAMRNLLGYWAHLDPEPMGLTLPDEGKVIVDGLNMVTRHQKPRGRMGRTPAAQLGAIQKPAPLPVSNVMLICPKCSKEAKTSSEVAADGFRGRKCKKCGELVD